MLQFAFNHFKNLIKIQKSNLMFFKIFRKVQIENSKLTKRKNNK